MENKKNTLTVILIIIIAILCSVIGWLLGSKLSIPEQNLPEGNNNQSSNSNNDGNNGILLKYIEYKIINPKKVGYNDKEQWLLVKYNHDDASETGNIPVDDIVNNVDNKLVSQMDGYEYGFIDGYYKNSAFYTSLISNKKLVIKKVDFNKENQSYDEYININMPEDYELCGIWEGTRKNNNCSATILDINENNIYIYTTGKEYTQDIYMLNVDKKTITKISSTYKDGPHSVPKVYNYEEKVILQLDAGIFMINKTVENNIETIYSLQQYSSDIINKVFTIKDNEFYFSTDKIEYDSEQSPNGRTEIRVDYKYNFNTKKLSKIKENSNYIP